LGFAQARIKPIKAWSRLFALFAMVLLVVATLVTRLLLRGNQQASACCAGSHRVVVAAPRPMGDVAFAGTTEPGALWIWVRESSISLLR